MSDLVTRARTFRKEVLDKCDLIDAAGGIKTSTEQSDKVGFDFIRYYVNDVLVRSDYVAQENPVGVKDNPFEFTEELKMIQNAWYILDGVKKVWIGEAGVTTTWDNENLVEME